MGKDIEWLSRVSGVDKGVLKRILEGDLSFDDPIHVRETLKRISWVLDIELEMEGTRIESTSSKTLEVRKRVEFDRFAIVILMTLAVILMVQIAKVSSEPPAYIIGRAVVNGAEVEGEYPVWRSVLVTQEGSVLIRTFGGKTFEVMIREFEVMVDGRSEDPRSR